MDVTSNSVYNTPYANTSILPLLLLSLAHQQNAPKTVTSFKSEYDYVIVGAGAAGSVVASRLTELPCVSVLLLEAGKSPPLLTDVPVLSRNFWRSDLDWNYKTVPQKKAGGALENMQFIWPSGKGISGSSMYSAGVYTRCNKLNFDSWARNGAVGWSASDVWPYFLKLEDNRDPEFLADGYHVVDGPQTVEKPKYISELKKPILEAAEQLGYKVLDPNALNQTGFFDPQEFLRDGQRCTVAKAYLVPVENRTNLHILPNAFVKKVTFKKGRATGVEFVYGGKTNKVKAKREVILSAGTVNTAQLLMLSGVGPKEQLKKLKIPLVADLPVGQNFQDQCGSVLSFTSNVPSLLEKITNPSNIDEYIKNKTGPLTETEGVFAAAFLNKELAPTVDFPDNQIYFAELPAQIIQATLMLRQDVYNQVYAPYENSSLYICLVQTVQPKSKGTITLNITNPHGPPLIDPNYLDDDSDVEAIVAGLKVCQEIGTSEQLKQIGSTPLAKPFPGCEKYDDTDDDFYKCMAKYCVMAMTHQVGTAKMGDPKDKTTVVDPRLRVKGIDGLRVVDASIMPTILTGNSLAPTMMVAEKASDMIKETLNCDTQIRGV